VAEVKQFEKLREFVAGEKTADLGTISPAGALNVSPVFYWSDKQLRIYWLSASKSEHSQNVAERADVALAIHCHAAEWREIRGVQMKGAVRIVEGKEREKILKSYKKHFDLGAVFQLAILASTLYCFEPRWMRMTDNTQFFGEKFELTLFDKEWKVTRE